MVLVLDLPQTTTLLKQVGLSAFLSQLVTRLTADFARWPQFQHRPRVAYDAHDGALPIGVLELMPIADDAFFSFKYVNGHPRNTQMGKLNVVAFGCLTDTQTGYPLLLCEMTLLTALRTAATSAMAARAMMVAGATRHAIIGTGAQAEFQALAMAVVCGLNQVSYFDKDQAAMRKFARNMGEYKNIVLRAATSVHDAVRDVQVITTATATKGRTQIIAPADMQAGQHFNAIGGDAPGKTEYSVDVLQRCKIAVEYEPQTRIEGEIQQLPPDFPVTLLWRLVSGQEKIRQSSHDMTLFDSVGYALEDFSTLRLIYDLAQRHKAGTPTTLIPALSNPKDLYALFV